MNYFIVMSKLYRILMLLGHALDYRRLGCPDRLQNHVVIEVLAPSKFGNLNWHNYLEGTYYNYLSTKSTSPLLPPISQRTYFT